MQTLLSRARHLRVPAWWVYACPENLYFSNFHVTPFAFTIFAGAFLLFLIQPLIGKFLLPLFGGAPGVWTTCLLFFQSLLLGGYLYAHLSTKWLSVRSQAILHLSLIVTAISLPPIAPPPGWKPDNLGDPTPQILSILLRTIGLPYLALAGTGPLLQHWFSRKHPDASPYRLYSLSNLGSLLALVSFPLFLEVQFNRKINAVLWGWGLVVYAISCVVCVKSFWRFTLESPSTSISRAPRNSNSAPLSLYQRLLWLLLPASASALLMATTNKICQDVAVVPLLWLLPLGLYLLSFIICFDNPLWYKRMPFYVLVMISWFGIQWLLTQGAGVSILVSVSILSSGLFLCCMVAHGELYRLKPLPSQLTEFYLSISAGGVLGGIFVAVIAPLVFHDYSEWRFGLLASGLLFLVVLARDLKQIKHPKLTFCVCVGLLIGLVTLCRTVWTANSNLEAVKVYESRNFYGRLTIEKSGDETTGQGCFRLIHGKTVHGMQFFRPSDNVPTLYYAEDSGVGLTFAALSQANRRVGVIGLGIGTLVTYGRPGDYFRYYEIDPEVIRLAKARFTCLANTTSKVEVSVGDARLSLTGESGQNFDLLVLDAFSSDAIPVHLLTREAFITYGRHLKTNGVIAVHISNHYLDLESVLINVAKHFDYRVLVVENGNLSKKWWVSPSTWVLLSRNESFMSDPNLEIASRPAKKYTASIPLWTDDFVSLFQIIKSEAAPVVNEFSLNQIAKANELCKRRDFAGAVEVYRHALREESNAPELLNKLAWLLATSPNLSIRDGRDAALLAEKACELTHYQVAGPIETLGAAYAESGRFQEAIKMATKANILGAESGDVGLHPELLERYRLKKAVGR